ncbi:MAG TPA: LuxR C-terminal-related transcriptional regulator [Steroidobacter sp.]|jgi:LuxR family maltose regulon positive regulatory protein|nr:LuxR C-terminal-related transcriptional regulator [Steroidobacter sp.]
MAFATNPNILLQIKIVPPVLRADLCQRPRLLERVHEGRLPQLTLVRAPAGYGKTTLLQQIAEVVQRRGEHVAWLSFDRSDSHVELALAYLSAAFGQINPAINERMAPHFERLKGGAEIRLISALIRALEQWNEPVVLIIDDLHNIIDPIAQECLRFFVNNAPPHVRCVFASREPLPWEFERLADPTRTQLIDAAVLRFTAAETLHLLKEVRGYRLDENAVNSLAEKTEGWIAGIQLFASSIGKSDHGMTLDRKISGSNAMLFEYLAGAVLSGQSEEVSSFLLQTAPLKRFTAELCQRITGNENAHQIIGQLERENLFLVPLDANRQWYRYHMLFAEFLAAKLQRERKYDLNAIHRKASRWFQANRLPMEAMQHALAANDQEQIAALLDAAARQSMHYSQLNMLVGWLDQMPPDAILRAGVSATLTVIWAYLCCRHFDKAQGLIAKVQAILDGETDASHGEISPKDRPSLELAIIELERQLLPHKDNLSRIRDIRERLGANWNMERAIADTSLGLAHLRRNELELAYVAMLEARAQAEAAGHFFIMAEVLSSMADVRLQQGRLADSRRLCEEVVERFSTRKAGPIPQTGFAHLILAEIDYEQNRIDEAYERLRVADALNKQRNNPEVILRGRLLAARIEARTLDAASQTDHLLQITNAGIHWESSEVANQLFAMQVCALARSHQLQAAHAMLVNRGMPVSSSGPPWQLPLSAAEEPLYLALGSYHFAAQNYGAALNWFRFLLQWSRRSGREISQARHTALIALAHAAQNRSEDAMRTLREMLQIGARLGLGRCICDLGEEMQLLLKQYCEVRETQFKRGGERDPTAAYARQLLELSNARRTVPSVGAESPEAGAPGAQELADPLTRRELEILRLVTEGMSNQEIADELLIARTSVKWHIKNIFSKLYVSSRTQAIARAREARLIC